MNVKPSNKIPRQIFRPYGNDFQNCSGVLQIRSHMQLQNLPFSFNSFKHTRDGSINENDGGFCVAHHKPANKEYCLEFL